MFYYLLYLFLFKVLPVFELCILCYIFCTTCLEIMLSGGSSELFSFPGEMNFNHYVVNFFMSSNSFCFIIYFF